MFFRGIKNLFLWFPVIWNTGRCDSVYFFDIMRFQLKLMEKFFRKESHLCRSEREAKKMKICVLLIDRIIADNYHDIAFKYHDRKWGKLCHYSRPTDNPYLRTLELSRPNIKNKEDEIQESKEAKRLHAQWDYLQKQDIEYLFHIMTKHISYWWD